MNTDWFLWHDPSPFVAHQLISQKTTSFSSPNLRLYSFMLYPSAGAYHQPTYPAWAIYLHRLACFGADWGPTFGRAIGSQNRWSEIIPNKYDVFNLNPAMKPCTNSRIFTRNFTSISQASTASLELGAHVFVLQSSYSPLSWVTPPHSLWVYIPHYKAPQTQTATIKHEVFFDSLIKFAWAGNAMEVYTMICVCFSS